MADVPIPEDIFARIEALALPTNPLVKHVADVLDAPTKSTKPIEQGDIYWVQVKNYPHPHVVLQHTLLNQTRVPTIVMCALTTNLKKASYPGNIRLNEGEANLPKESIIEVSKVSAVPKDLIGDYIGSLSTERIEQIFAGLRLLQRSHTHQ